MEADTDTDTNKWYGAQIFAQRIPRTLCNANTNCKNSETPEKKGKGTIKNVFRTIIAGIFLMKKSVGIR